MWTIDSIKGIFDYCWVVVVAIIAVVDMVVVCSVVGRNGRSVVAIGVGRSRMNGLGNPMWIIGMGNPRWLHCCCCCC